MNGRANDYVKEWLGAYIDGELSADRRGWVEEHLATCPDCQKELAELRALTTLLHADPAPFLAPGTLPAANASASADASAAETFARQIVKRLPRPVQPAWQRALRTGLRYMPLGLFGAWAFLQAVVWVSTALLYALHLFPQTEGWLAWLAPDLFARGLQYEAGGWLGGLFSLSGSDSLALQVTGSVLFSPIVLIEVAGILLLAVLFFSWLAGLWAYQRTQTSETA